MSPQIPSTNQTGRFARRVALLMWALAAGATAARANLIVNESFESGPAPGQYVEIAAGSTVISGWVIMGGSIDYVGDGWNAADGTRSVSLNGSNPGGISQTFSTVAGESYTVNFLLAGDAFGFPTMKHLRVTAAGQSQDFEFCTGHSWPWELGWLRQTFMFTANSGSATLAFTSLDSGNQGPALDKVVVALSNPTGVPESPVAGFQLVPPYPNPASRGVWIAFDVPRESPVRVSVADVQGREIRLITEERYPAGRHTLFWDGRVEGATAPAGFYLVRLVSPETTLVRKTALIH